MADSYTIPTCPRCGCLMPTSAHTCPRITYGVPPAPTFLWDEHGVCKARIAELEKALGYCTATISSAKHNLFRLGALSAGELERAWQSGIEALSEPNEP